MSHRRAFARMVAVLLLAASACLDDAPLAPDAAASDVRLRIHAQITGGSAVDRTVKIRVFYRRAAGGETSQEVDLPSSPSEIVVPSGTTRTQEVVVQLLPCLADQQRVGAASGCRFSIELTLIDTDGELLSRQTQEVTASSPGQTVETPTITLPAAEVGVSSATASFTAEELAAVPAAQTVTITSVTGAPLGTLSATVAYASSSNWLTASVDQSTKVLTLRPSTTDPIAPVTYTATVTVRSSRPSVKPKDIAVTYTLTPRPRTLTVTPQGTGSGKVTSNPAGIDCSLSGGVASGTCSAAFPFATQVTLSASPGTDSDFGGFAGSCSGGSCQVTMDQPRDQARAVTASFAIAARRLTVTGAGDGTGRVTSEPAGIDCAISSGATSASCTADFRSGTTVTLTATPAPGGHGFGGWSGACTGGGTCSVTMDAPKTVGATFTAPPKTPGVISNGTVWFGILPTGNLNVPNGGPPSAGTGTTTLGLRYLATNYDGISPGCECEGWGVADSATGVTGYANVSSGTSNNLTVENFTTTSTQVVSVVKIGSTFRVTHDYHPSPVTPYLFEVRVSIQNMSETAVTDLRYRRVMDWDVEPTAFNEIVTIKGSTTASAVLYASDDGFASADPLSARSKILFEGDATNSGPDDHGALFDFGFGSLAPGATKTFTLYYGAAGNEQDALAALRAVGAEVYSLGKPSSDPTNGTPNTFMIGFTGVGGSPIVSASAVRAAAGSMIVPRVVPGITRPASPNPRNRRP